ncbi:Uncharacterised protein [Escherichia coli]|nr:Uncharacterised protein [Escherichia coli]VVZ76915.1 Uncharacterised protein [Escherichia coli]VWM58773.1 Uncharacterised protein [Escherichia coli]VWN02206.1 Uncharacterised protein [Escherichia coli]
MSSLIFYTDEAQALIVTDTLAVTDNGEPLSFVSKAGYIPQLRTIIAGTGAGGFSNTWLLEASTRMVVSGIQNLNYHTSACLRRLWKQYKHGFAPIFPDTCYHLTHYWPAAADIPVASDNPAHYADAIRYNARTPLQGSLLPLTRLVWA